MKEYMRMIQKAAACLIGVAALLLTSCEKNEEITDNYLPSGDEQCMLLPPSISVEPFGGGSVFTRAASAIKEERQQFNVGEELGNIVTLGNGETESIPQTRANIAAGVFYRMVVYKLDDWNNNTLKVHEQRLCKAGSTEYFADAGDVITPIYLYPGSYKIFCYSFNKTSTDKMTKLSDGTVNLALSDGDDFMSTVIDKTIVASDLGKNVSLGALTLYHRCCKLTGSLTAEGFDDNTITDTPSLSISGTLTQTGNWSINGSNFAVVSTLSTKTIPLSGSGASRAGSVIMLPFTNKALKATYSFKPSSSKTTLSATDASLSAGTTFDSGGNYTFTVKGIGAYVITAGVDAILIAGDTWATRNVRYNNTFETNLDIWNSGNLRGATQASTVDEPVNSDYNSYFMWGNKTAYVSGGSYNTGSSEWPSSTNPCPSGYKVPTKDQLTNLITKKMPNGKKVSINGEVHTIGNAYGFYNGTQARGLVLLDGDTVLFLPAAGYRRTGTDWFGVGSYGRYWSSTPEASDVYALYFGDGDCNVYYDYDARYYGRSVRCVK